MNIDFIGAGWSFPLGTDATGGVALVTREREIEQAIRLILGTACGERPMRPEFGCRIHDHVFGTGDLGDGRADRVRRPRGPGALGAADRGADVAVQLRRDRVRHALRRHRLHGPRAERPAQPGLPVLRHPQPNAEPGGRLGRRAEGSTAMLPAPNLDDRRFQDLVDDAKRLVQQRCPEWTDHNVSDPGVTLIEAFAQMVDQLIYRLNRVPDLHYVKFLELIGVELRPPAAGPRRGHVLAVGAAAAAGAGPGRDPGGDAAYRHLTSRSSSAPPGTWRSCPARSPTPPPRPVGKAPVDMTTALSGPGGFRCFSAPPRRSATRC